MAGTAPPTEATRVRDSLWTSQLDARRQEIEDNIFKATPFLAEIGARRQAQLGGERLYLNVEKSKNTTIASIGKGQPVSLADTDPVTAAFYVWRTIAGNVTRYREEDRINTGRGMLFSLIDAKVQNLINSMSEELETQLLDTNAQIDFNGIQDLIAEDPTASTTVGAIDPSTNTWWRNDFYDHTSDSVNALLIDNMRTRVTNIMKETGRKPDAIVTTYELADTYEQLALDLLTLMKRTVGDYSYETIAYKGIPFVPSAFSVADSMFFVTWRNLFLKFDPGMWFTQTDWKEPENQPFDKVKQIVARGNMCTNARRSHSVMFNIGDTA